jgi:hypothetical protein
MEPRSMAARMLEQEARALLTRLDRVKPFALHETMLPAAALAPAAQIAIERFLIDGRAELRRRIRDYLEWVRRDGDQVAPEELQRRFTGVRWRFNDVLSQFDLFQQAITQRSEREIGVWLSGLDVAAADALALTGDPFEPPSIICYLDRGQGAAIRRARTRLPGGGNNPVSIIRIPRERMVGHGIASSLVHEVGHQGAALLGLVESLRPALSDRETGSAPGERVAWQLWGRWISEILADFWSVAKLGIASTLGLIGVVSLPRWFVFRLNLDDPHPFPWIRVQLSCAIGNALYPHPQWRELAVLWASLYPPEALDAERRRIIDRLGATMPALVGLLVEHRPGSLGGHSLKEMMPLDSRTPDRLRARYQAWAARPAQMRTAAPTLVFAVLGQARTAGLLSPEQESRVLGDLLSFWALRSTLDLAQLCATRSRGRLVPPATRPTSDLVGLGQ